MFEKIIVQGVNQKSFRINKNSAKIVSHNIMVQGQMWAFRRWVLQKNFSLNAYIKLQTELTLNALTG